MNNFMPGEKNPNWRGGRSERGADGYIVLLKPEHERANVAGYVREHLLIAEKALGKPLPAGALVDHFDCDKSNNDHQNLIICEGIAYHAILHQRKRAYKACGRAGWLRCKFCKVYDDPQNLYFNPKNRPFHRCCHARYKRELLKKKRGLLFSSLHLSEGRE